MIRVAFQYFRSLRQAGITDCPSEVPSLGELRTAPSVYGSTDAQPGLPQAPDSPGTPLGQPDSSARLSELTSADRAGQLIAMAEEVAACQACPELVSCRTQTVFGVGSATPRLCFLGEGPGADEDRLGEPFVGRAGQLLNRIIEACGMQRSDVYILNTVKCRPPGNRNPTDEEIANCWDFAQRQLEILRPEFICCLGAVAARSLLKTGDSVGRLRQRLHDFQGAKVVVTYHPAYLLRSPDAKSKTWDDMKMLMREMGTPVS